MNSKNKDFLILILMYLCWFIVSENSLEERIFYCVKFLVPKFGRVNCLTNFKSASR